MKGNQAQRGKETEETGRLPLFETALFDEQDQEMLTAIVNEVILGGVIITYLEPDFPYIFANKAYLELLDYASEEEYIQAIGNRINQGVYPEDRIYLNEEKIKRCIELGRYDRNHRLQKKDGSYIWVENRAKVVALQSGKHAIICTCVDITSLMEAKQALEHEEIKLNHVIEAIPGGVGLFAFRKDCIEVIYASDSLLRTLALSKAEYRVIAREDAKKVIYEKDLIRVERNFHEWFKNPEQPLELTVRLINGENAIVWIHMYIQHLFQDDEMIMLHVAFRNISEEGVPYDRLFDFSDMVIEIIDLETLEILYANRKACEITNHGSEDYLGKTCYNWFRHSETICPDCQLEEIKKKGYFAYETVGMDGRVYQVQMQKIRWRGREAFGEFATDITAEKQIEELRERERNKQRARYEEQADNLQTLSCMYVMTMKMDLTDECILEITDNYQPLSIDIQRAQLTDIRRELRTRFPSAQAEEELFGILNFEYLRAQYAEGNKQFKHQQEHCLKDGTMLWLDYSFNIRTNPDTGHLIAFVCARDITYEKLNAIALQKIAEDAYLFIATVNSKTGRYMKYATRNHTNTPTEGVYEHTLSRAIVSFVADDKKEEIRKAFALDNVQKKLDKLPSYKMVVETGSRQEIKHYVYEFCYINDARTIILLTASDITEAVSMERENQQKIEEALIEAQEANIAKSAFFSNMSHDIRTPLNAILNLTALMRDELKDPHALAADLDKIEMSSNYLLGLINEVLDMTKIESGKMELHPEIYRHQEFMEYIESVITPMCIPKNITFTLNEATIAADIFVDKVRLNQIFMNLMSNAIKYTDYGGEVSLTIANQRVHNHILSNEFIVRDNGRGMSAEFQKRLFSPFEREDTSNAYSGTGLGLSITKTIVEKMGGTIRIESKQGEGTTVTVRLEMPIVEMEDGGSEKKDKTEKSQHSDNLENCRGKRILVAEDHALNQEIVVRILEQFGVISECVSNGEEAVRQFQEHGPGYYDAVLMDIRMPVMDGYEAAKAIRKSERTDAADLPIIAMTAEAFESDVQAAKEAGMNDHLAKPINPKGLLETLCRWVGIA